MNSLFNQEVKASRSIIAIILLGGAFYVLNNLDTPINFFIILLAGLIGTWLVFGTEGIKKIFSKPKKGYFKFIILSVVASYLINIVTGIISKYVINQAIAENPIKDQFSGSLLSSFGMLLKTIFMLAGEEIFVMLPLIILVSLLIHKTKISEKSAIIISSIITAVIFGAIHLPTYQWNLFQCLIVVAVTRIPFTIVSLRSKSIIPGIVGHVIFDWIIFAGMIISQL